MSGLSVNEKDALDQARQELTDAIVGQRIVGVDTTEGSDVRLLTESGRVVLLDGVSDCCAYGEVELIKSLPTVAHVITSVTAEEGSNQETWFILSEGIPVASLYATAYESNGYYSYGINVTVVDA